MTPFEDCEPILIITSLKTTPLMDDTEHARQTVSTSLDYTTPVGVKAQFGYVNVREMEWAT